MHTSDGERDTAPPVLWTSLRVNPPPSTGLAVEPLDSPRGVVAVDADLALAGVTRGLSLADLDQLVGELRPACGNRRSARRLDRLEGHQAGQENDSM